MPKLLEECNKDLFSSTYMSDVHLCSASDHQSEPD